MFWPSFMISPLKAAGAVSCPSKRGDEEDICLVPLTKLQRGQCGLIQRLDLNDSDDKRLRTLGICPGRRVWLVRRGDPMVLKVMGTRIGLAVELAQQVTVEVCTPPSKGVQSPPEVRLEREPGEHPGEYPGEPGASGGGQA